MRVTWCCAILFAECCVHGQDSTVCIQKSVMTRCVKKQGKSQNKNNKSKVKVWFSPSLLLFYLFLLRVIHLWKPICQISSLSSKRDRLLVQDTREIWELVSFFPLLLWGWASLLISLNLCSSSVAQEECVFFSPCCAIPSLLLCDWWATSGP